jgi:aldose 1-epimerase
MSLITLTAGGLRLVVVPSLGAGIADFSLQGPSGVFYPMMRRACPGEGNASLLGSFFMAPWVNRIANAAFTFRGREHRLTPNTKDVPPMAQHGDVRKRPWRVEAVAGDHARLVYDSREHADSNWPWAYMCVADYRLDAGGVTIGLDVTNADDEPFPAGCGHHPYFARRLMRDDDRLVIHAPVAGRYPLVKGCAAGEPSPDRLTDYLSQPRLVPETHVDDVFSGFGGMASLRWEASGVTLRMTASPNMGHLVVFAPHADSATHSPLPFVAVEPQTQVNDALNLAAKGYAGTGTVVLEPGETLRTSVRFEVLA